MTETPHITPGLREIADTYWRLINEFDDYNRRFSEAKQAARKAIATNPLKLHEMICIRVSDQGHCVFVNSNGELSYGVLSGDGQAAVAVEEKTS
jgi:hypothetical protein